MCIVDFADVRIKAHRKIPHIIIHDVDFEWLMIDATHVKVHSDSAGAVGDKQTMRTKGGTQYKNSLCPG